MVMGSVEGNTMTGGTGEAGRLESTSIMMSLVLVRREIWRAGPPVDFLAVATVRGIVEQRLMLDESE